MHVHTFVCIYFHLQFSLNTSKSIILFGLHDVRLLKLEEKKISKAINISGSKMIMKTNLFINIFVYPIFIYDSAKILLRI